MANTFNNYLTTLNGIAVTRYAKKVTVMYPENVAPLTSMLQLKSGQRLGLQYQFPLDLTYDDSTTYAAAGAGAFSFTDTVAGQMAPALVNSSNYAHRGFIDYETIARTQNNGDPSSGAMEDAVDRMLFRMNKGLAANIEADFWYGGTNIGVIQAVLVGDGSNGVASGQARITITNKSFAPGLFVARKGSRLDCYAITASTGRPTSTKRNANAPLVIQRFTLASRYVYVSGNSSDLAALTAGDGLLKYDTYSKGTQGMDYVMTAGGTTLYSIDTTAYDMMEPNVVSNGDLALTLKRLYAAMSDAISKGLGEDGVDVWLNPDVFGDLLAQETLLVRHGQVGGNSKNGYRGLTFDSQVGLMTFKPNRNIKRGEVFVGPTMETCSKVGAQEPELKNFSNSKEQSFLIPVRDQAACESQIYGNLGFLNEKPALWTKITDVVPESAS